MKIIVKIDLGNVTKEEILNEPDYWYDDGETISLDGASLREDREDDSFYEFEFVGFEE